MKPRRKRFADGSAVVTYPDGSRLILESALAKSAVLCEGGPVSYSQSPRRATVQGVDFRLADKIMFQ